MQTTYYAGVGGVAPARDPHAPKRTQPWEIVHPQIPFAILTKNPVRTIRKLLDRYPDYGMWVAPPNSIFYYMIDDEVLNKLMKGEEVTTTYTDSPGAPGAAWGTATIGPEFLNINITEGEE